MRQQRANKTIWTIDSNLARRRPRSAVVVRALCRLTLGLGVAGCASFKPRSAIQNDSSGRAANGTTVRTARFAGDPSNANLPPAAHAAAAPNAPQPASVATVSPQPQQAAPQIYNYNQPPVNYMPVPATFPQPISYAPAPTAAQFQQAANLRWPTGSTGSTFTPAGALAVSQPNFGAQPSAGFSHQAMTATGNALTPSTPLADKLGSMRLHPSAVPNAVGNAAGAERASISNSRREGAQQFAPPGMPALDDAAVRQPGNENRPQLDEPNWNRRPASNPVRDALVPSAPVGDSLPPPRNNTKPLDPPPGEFQVPQRPNPATGSTGSGNGLEPPKPLLAPPPPVGVPRQ